MGEFCKFRRRTVCAALVAFSAAAFSACSFAEEPDKWVRYVEATGSQFVDTGIVGRYGTKAECKVEWTAFSDSAFLASRSGVWDDPDPGNRDGRMYFCYCLDTAGSMYTAQGTGEKVVWNGNWECRFESNRVYTYVSEFSALDAGGMSTNTITADGLGVWSKASAGIDTGYSLYLFAINQRGSAISKAKARCYGLKIWQDGDLVRDFQPCMKGGRAGLYDTVSKTVFYSGSSVDLVCDENSEVPDEFIEYVESQGDAALEGSGQSPAYIDTGVAGRSGTKMSGEFAILANEDRGLLGARSKSGGDDVRFYLLQSYKGRVTCAYGEHKANSYDCEIGQKYMFETTLDAGLQTMRRSEVGGAAETLYSATDAAVYDTGLSMHLFACNYDGEPKWFSKARCYGFRIWQDNVLVRDFRPCLKNGVAGLYDDVTKRIYYSHGTPFAFDNQKDAVEDDLLFVEYIESDGNNTLDTGIEARSGTRAAGDMAWVGGLRTWQQEKYRYLEATSAPGVFSREWRAYLAAVNAKSGGERFFMVHAVEACLNFAYGKSGNVYALDGEGQKIQPGDGERHSFDASFGYGAQTLQWDGETVFSTNIAGSVETGSTLHLFSSSSWRNRSAARCYGLKIWQDGILVRDFSPCVCEGKGMLYDNVTKCLFRPSPDIPASRTGSPVLSGLEKPVAYVDYVESDGTIFVDTGVTGRSGTAAGVKMEFLEKTDCGFLESRTGSSRFYLWHNYTKYDKMMYGYGAYHDFGEAATGVVYEVYSSLATNSQVLSVNGTRLVDAADEATVDTKCGIYVFACDQGGTPTYPGAARLYWLRMYQDGELVRNFKPVKLSNGIVALWDFVERKPYLPQTVSEPGRYTTFSASGPEGAAIRQALRIFVR